MKADVVPVEVKAVIPTTSKSQGCAVFVGNAEKVFVIYVDLSMGQAITMFIQDIPRERPLTHDLIGLIFQAMDVKLERVIINELKNNTYFARLILRVDNEIHHKVLELDARPSDCIALAMQAKAPLYVSREVWNEVEDNSKLLDFLHSKADENEGDVLDGPESEEDEDDNEQK